MIRSAYRQTAIRTRLAVEHMVYQETQTENHDLCCYCAIASGILFLCLKHVGLDSTLCLSQEQLGSHVFLIAEDHVIDITATQFRKFANQPVVIIHEKSATEWYHRVDESFDTVKDLIKFQKKSKWPKSQIAYSYFPSNFDLNLYAQIVD